MKPYNVEFEITTEYAIEISANNEAEALQIVEEMDVEKLETEAEFRQPQAVEVTYVEEITDVD